VYLRDMQIAKYSHGTYANHEEKRPRKLLLNRKEIVRLAQRLEERGYTAVPLKLYFKDQFVKVEIGIAKGKKLHDKRETAKTKEATRDIARALRARNRA
jgi:SsrA-binding protein